MSAAPWVTLWHVEHVNNDEGYWVREWFADDVAAWAGYDRLRTLYRSTDRAPEDLCGEYGDVCAPREAQVTMTAAGVLDFAQEWATGESDV